MASYEVSPTVDLGDHVVMTPKEEAGLMMARLLRMYPDDTEGKLTDADYRAGYVEPITGRCDIKVKDLDDVYAGFRLRGRESKSGAVIEGDRARATERSSLVCIELEYVEDTALLDFVDDRPAWRPYVVAVLNPNIDCVYISDEKTAVTSVAVDLLWKATGRELDEAEVDKVVRVLRIMQREMLANVEVNLVDEIPRPTGIFEPVDVWSNDLDHPDEAWVPASHAATRSLMSSLRPNPVDPSSRV